MTLMERRRLLMGSQKESNILFDWDYTDGLDKISIVDAIAPVMQSDGLRLQGGNTAYSACGIAPAMQPPVTNHKTTIEYKDLVSNGSNSAASFFLFDSTAKRVKIFRQRTSDIGQAPIRTGITNADASAVLLSWNLADSGEIEIEYNAQANTVTFKQGANSETIVIATPSAWAHDPLVCRAQTGSETTRTTGMTIRHIKIEKVLP